MSTDESAESISYLMTKSFSGRTWEAAELGNALFAWKEFEGLPEQNLETTIREVARLEAKHRGTLEQDIEEYVQTALSRYYRRMQYRPQKGGVSDA